MINDHSFHSGIRHQMFVIIEQSLALGSLQTVGNLTSVSVLKFGLSVCLEPTQFAINTGGLFKLVFEKLVSSME